MRKVLTGLTALFFIVMPLSAYAATVGEPFSFVLGHNNIGSGGKVSYLRSSNQLTSSDIKIYDLVIGSSNYEVSKSELIFSSASNAGNSWTRGAGGDIRITGAIKDLEINDPDILLTGKLAAFSIQKDFIIFLGKTNYYYNVIANITDLKLNDKIAVLFTNNNYKNGVEFRFSLNSGQGDSQLNSGDYFNKKPIFDGSVGIAHLPIPATAWIFLTGIAGLAGLVRKNKK